MIYKQLEDKEHALEWLEKAYAIRDPKMPYIKTMGWKKFENDPRFQDIMRGVGFSTLSDPVPRTQTKIGSTVWTVEYIVTGIRRHKLAAALIVSVIFVGILAAFFKLKNSRVG